MQNRKILTLEEVLKLKRRPTLQEMVDLTHEEYVMYLYEKGIIDYIPENYDLWDYGYDYNNYDSNRYEPWEDPVLLLKNPIYEELNYTVSVDGLNESKTWDDPNVIERGVIYTKNGTGVEYTIDEHFVRLYEKNSKGEYEVPNCLERKHWRV